MRKKTLLARVLASAETEKEIIPKVKNLGRIAKWAKSIACFSRDSTFNPNSAWAVSLVVERHIDIVEVRSSILLPPTLNSKQKNPRDERLFDVE